MTKATIHLYFRVIHSSIQYSPLDFHGVKMVVTHFVTQFTHVSIHFGVNCRNKIKLFRGNCLFEEKMADVSPKLKRKRKRKKIVYNLWRILETKLVLSKQFSLNIFVLFSILRSKLSRNMCKLCHKVRNGQNLPHETPNFTNLFSFEVTLHTTIFQQV